MQESILTLIQQVIRTNWEHLALTDFNGESLQYKDLGRKIAKLHLLFEHTGVKPGDKIAICGKNRSQWAVAFLGTLTYGAVAVPILHEFKPDNIHHLVNHSDARLFFADTSIYENLDPDSMPKLEGAVLIKDFSLLLCRNEKLMHARKHLNEYFGKKYPERFTPDDVDFFKVTDDMQPCIINYTSGSTGFSKGVMLTYGNICGNVMFGIDSRLHFRGSRNVAFLPLAHAYGCAFDMLVPLAVGSHITIFSKPPIPQLLLKAMAEVKPDLIVCVPLVLEKIYRKQIVPMITRRAMRWALAVPLLDTAIYAKIRHKLIEAFGGRFEEVIIGGAPLNSEVEQFLHRIRFPFTVGYGMTECGPLISYTPWREFVPSSCGRTLHNMESKILSDDPSTIPGEICVRGQNRMAGYYKNPDVTAMTIDEDGWLHTGDMGTRSADGTLFIKGRYKTMILSASGQNIYPEEIEAKLNNMAYVSESLIVERGKGLTALVYPDYERMDADRLTVADLSPIMERNRNDLNQLVAPYERVDYIQLTPQEFEKTPKKSIKRYLYS